jgi:transposase-like protein
MAKSKKRWSGEEKLEILKEGQTSGASISEVCRRHGINPAQYYQWLKASEEGAKQALSRNGKEKPSQREERLLRDLERMKAVIVEITAENLDLKKSLGE